ncbi:MAG: ABC transporter permease [Methylococcales bacterium]
MKLENTIELIFYKAYADIKAESARSYLGLIWWTIEPVIYLCAFYVIFVYVLKRGGQDFVPFFLCGMVVWKWFASGLSGGSQSILANRGLLQQVYVPKFVFPIIAMLGSTVRFLPVFFVLCAFLLVYGKPIHASWIALPLVISTQFLFVLSMALLAGAIIPFLPDLKVAIDNGLMFLFFVSGVFFDINEIHDPARTWLLLNPMAALISEYRNILLSGAWPDWSRLGIVAILSLILAVPAFFLLRKCDLKYGKIPV